MLRIKYYIFVYVSSSGVFTDARLCIRTRELSISLGLPNAHGQHRQCRERSQWRMARLRGRPGGWEHNRVVKWWVYLVQTWWDKCSAKWFEIDLFKTNINWELTNHENRWPTEDRNRDVMSQPQISHRWHVSNDFFWYRSKSPVGMVYTIHVIKFLGIGFCHFFWNYVFHCFVVLHSFTMFYHSSWHPATCPSLEATSYINEDGGKSYYPRPAPWIWVGQVAIKRG